MRKLVLLVLCLCFLKIYPQAEIVGGEDCDISDYPWQAAIYADGYLCGASVIHQYWVITAAHCVEESNQVIDAESITVGVGSSSQYAGLFGAGGDEYEVEEVISHAAYGNNGNDIALLKTKQPIQFSDDVQPISIICSDQVNAGAQDVGVMTVVTGWGNTSQGGEGSDVLQYIEVPIVDYDDPDLDFPWWADINEVTEILVGAVDGGMDSCQGDSGGPVAVRNVEDTDWLLMGITSWGSGCAQAGRPGVYTKVSNYLNWINTNTDGCIDANISTACDSSIENPGCTDETACNFDPAAETNTGCVYSTDPIYDCEGECVNNADGDGLCDEEDNCPDNINTSQSDTDNDGVGNACDNCLSVYNPDQVDFDGDGQGDACDSDDGLDITESLQGSYVIESYDVYGRVINGEQFGLTIKIYSDGRIQKTHQY